MVGELEGIVVPCVAVSMELKMSTISHIKPQISRLGSLNFPFGVFGDIVGARTLTEDVGVFAVLLVGSLSLVSCWLLFASALFVTNELSSKMEVLALRFGLDLAPNISSVLT